MTLSFSLLGEACSQATSEPSSTIPSLPNTTTVSVPTTSTATTIALISPSLTPDTSQMINRISQALTGISSYSISSTITTRKNFLNKPSDEITLRTQSNSVLGISTQQMEMKNIISAVQSGITKSMIENNFYIMDKTLYIQGMFPAEPATWNKTPLTEEYWQMQNQALKIAELLYGQVVSVLPSETVNDIDCDVLQVNPDLAAFWKVVAGQPGVQIPSESPEGVYFDQIVRKAEVKVWVDQTSQLPVKALLNLDFQIDAKMVPTYTTDVSMEISTLITFKNYNQAVAIVLPVEAQNAEDLSLTPLE